MAKLKNELVTLERFKVESGGILRKRQTLQGNMNELMSKDQDSQSSSSYNCDNLQIEVLDEANVTAQRFPRMPRDMKQQALVTGFNFPIADEDTVELLEAIVNVNQRIRDEYVGYEWECIC